MWGDERRGSHQAVRPGDAAARGADLMSGRDGTHPFLRRRRRGGVGGVRVDRGAALRGGACSRRWSWPRESLRRCGVQTVHQFGNVNANNLYMLQGEQAHPHGCSCRLAKVPHRFFNEPMDASAGVAMLSATAYVLPLLLVRRRPELLLGMLYVAGGVGIVAAFDLYRGSGNLDFIRYCLVASPGAYLVTVGLLSDRRGWLKHVIPAVAAVVPGIAAAARTSTSSRSSRTGGNWQWLLRLMGPRDVMVLTGHPSDLWYLELSILPSLAAAAAADPDASDDGGTGGGARFNRAGLRGRAARSRRRYQCIGGGWSVLAEFREAWLPPLAIYRGPGEASAGGPSKSPGYNAAR